MADYIDEHFEWDVGKSEEIFARHGFDFHLVAEMFGKAEYIDLGIDDRDYGEERVIAIGRIDGLFITAVYTIRGARKRIITAWRSHRTDIDEYVRRMGYRDEREN
jgi:hypothetical protein